MASAAVLPGKPGTERPAVRLREAELSDALALSELYATVSAATVPAAAEAEASGAEAERTAPSQAQMRAWLTSCGVLLVEDATGKPMAAVRYKNSPAGWDVDRIVTLPRSEVKVRSLADDQTRSLGHTRERQTTYHRRPGTQPVAYYRRMGYRTDADDPRRLSKKVGGMWQRQEVTR